MKIKNFVTTIAIALTIALTSVNVPFASAASSCKATIRAKKLALSSANRGVRTAQQKVRSKESALAKANADGTRILANLQRAIDSADRGVTRAQAQVDSANLRKENTLVELRRNEEELRAKILWAGGVACLAENMNSGVNAIDICARQVAIYTARYNVAMVRRKTREKSLQRTVDQKQKRLNEATAKRQKAINELMKVESAGANKAKIDKAQDALDAALRALSTAETKQEQAEIALQNAEEACA